MRQVLVDYARRHRASKRQGAHKLITISENLIENDGKDKGLSQLDILVLDDALVKLQKIHERMGKVVELKMFSGMRMREIAHVLEISKRTVAEDWSFAKLWLNRELGGAA
jgi:RNA polymerase sigma factor (TIGR02999 family)